MARRDRLRKQGQELQLNLVHNRAMRWCCGAGLEQVCKLALCLPQAQV